TPVEVGHRHRRCALRLLAVYFGVVTVDDFRIVADQERAADRKSAELPALRYARLLQQRDGVAARTDEDVIRCMVFNRITFKIPYLHFPLAVLHLSEVSHFMTVMDFRTLMVTYITHHFPRQFTKVHISAAVHPACRYTFISRTPFH